MEKSWAFFGVWVFFAALTVGCSGSTSSSQSDSSGNTTTSRTLTAYTSSTGTTVATTFEKPNDPGHTGGTYTTYNRSCAQVSDDTSSCEASREAIGIGEGSVSANFLDFSCNVVEGCASSSKATMSTCTGATYVTLQSEDLPNYTSNYYPTTGSYDFSAYSLSVTGLFDSLYAAYTTAFPDPGSIAAQTITMYIPITPTADGAKNYSMGMGVVGMAINGVVIFDNLASGTDNIFAEDGSFDQCNGHPAGSEYHYHSEPYAISYQDNNLIGVIEDGYFAYGRYDSPAKTNEPGSIANLESAGTSSDIYIYGGQSGTTDPVTGDTTTSTFRYYLTEWKGCYDSTTGSSTIYYADNAESYDGFDSSTTSGTVNCDGTWVDGWFITGHGNGGVFQTPASIGTTTGTSPYWSNGVEYGNVQSPAQNTAGKRYYYGVPGSCTGC